MSCHIDSGKIRKNMDYLDRLQREGKCLHFFPPGVKISKYIIVCNKREYVIFQSIALKYVLEGLHDRMGKFCVYPHNDVMEWMVIKDTMNRINEKEFDGSSSGPLSFSGESLEDGYFYSKEGVFYGRKDDPPNTSSEESPSSQLGNDGVCRGVTLKGVRCKRRCGEKLYCYLHR